MATKELHEFVNTDSTLPNFEEPKTLMFPIIESSIFQLASLFSYDMDPKTIPTSISSLTDSFPTNGVGTNFTDAMKEVVSLEGQYIRILQRIHDPS